MKDIVEHNIEQMNIEQLGNFVAYMHKNKYNKAKYIDASDPRKISQPVTSEGQK